MTRTTATASRRWVSIALLTATTSGCYELAPLDGTQLNADSNGWLSATSTPFGIFGHWFGYADHGDPPSSCSEAGMHPAETCSRLTSHELPYNTLGFPNQGGRMCVSGQVARVLQG
jgi:hypothetical protein